MKKLTLKKLRTTRIFWEINKIFFVYNNFNLRNFCFHEFLLYNYFLRIISIKKQTLHK